MADKDVVLGITADDSGLDSTLSSSVAAVKAAASQMSAAFEGLQGTLGKITGVFAGLTAALAGGAAFKEMIGATVNLTVESTQLGKALGISATEASQLKVAMGELFLSQDTVTAAGERIAKTLATNEVAFTKLGVATRDATGNFRPTLDIMLDTNAALLKFKEGTDRNVEGTLIYGRAWATVAPTLRLTKDAMDEAKANAEELGLTVGQRGAEQVQQYRGAMNAVHDVVLGVEKAIGDALLPVLTQLGGFFRDQGPVAIQVIRVALAGLVYAFEALVLPVEIIVEYVKAFAVSVGASVLGLMDTLMAAMRGDWAGAKAAWNNASQMIGDTFGTAWKNVTKDAEKARDAMINAGQAAAGASDAPTAAPGGSAASAGGKAQNHFGDFEAELVQAKAAYAEAEREQGSFQQYSLEQERAFWQAKLATANLSAEDRKEISKKIAEDSLAIDKQAFAAEIAALKATEAEYAKNAAVKLQYAQTIAADMKQRFGEESKEYQDAAREVITIEREKQEQLRQLSGIRAETTRNAALADITDAENAAHIEVELGRKTNAELIKEQQQFEQQRYQLERQGLDDAKSLIDPNTDPIAYAKSLAAIEQLELQHNQRMKVMRGQMVLESNKDMKGMFDSMRSGFSSVISSFLQGTSSIRQTIVGLVKAVVSSVAGMLADIAAKWAVAHIQQMASKKVEAVSSISADAAAAGAGGVASMAAAPWPLDLTAPAFGAAMSAAALAFAPAVSASGGYDIPSGVNPLVQAHAREMILPASVADHVRGSMGSGDSGGGDTHYHTHNWHALDHGSVQRAMQDPTMRRKFQQVFSK